MPYFHLSTLLVILRGVLPAVGIQLCKHITNVNAHNLLHLCFLIGAFAVYHRHLQSNKWLLSLRVPSPPIILDPTAGTSFMLNL